MQVNAVSSPTQGRWGSDSSVHIRSGWWQLVLLVLALFVAPAHAQYRASLQGTVADAQGAMVPGAQLTLTDKETNHAITTTSDGAGNFTFSELPPSTYKLEVTRDGFKTKVLDGVHIISDQANALNVVMEAGGKSETVTVNAGETPAIDTETGNISGTITQEDLAKMPDFGRDPLQLAQLAPGMFGDSSQNAGGGTRRLTRQQPERGSRRQHWSLRDREQAAGVCQWWAERYQWHLD